ncbi:MAG: hypothetical protein DRP64_14155 [Verrucomicrobia bacterium]|nr:MAG: hypothetical protein DRP64_14155 [Verrucomicrobiota bacterium]
MGLFIKICGICSRSDLEQISAFTPDALGFIQWPKSKRYIEPETVGQWETPEGIQRVGVFVDPSEEELMHAAEAARLDVLQLHRISNDWQIDRENFQGLEFWRALNPEDFKFQVSSFRFQVSNFKFHRLLLDSYDPETIGGTGKTCDWNQARELVQSQETPILLAGGLTPDNVAAAIEHVRPWGIDVSSGVEIEPGAKDIAKVEAFIASARESNRKSEIGNRPC